MPISANWVKTRARLAGPRDLLEDLSTPGQLRSWMPSSREPSARKWAGWFADCLSFIISREMMPIRSMPGLGLLDAVGMSFDTARYRLPAPGEVAQHVHLDLVGQVGDDRPSV